MFCSGDIAAQNIIFSKETFSLGGTTYTIPQGVDTWSRRQGGSRGLSARRLKQGQRQRDADERTRHQQHKLMARQQQPQGDNDCAAMP